MSRDLSDSDKRELIEAVKQRPYLYQKDHKDHHNRNMKDLAFEEIGAQLDPPITGQQASAAWGSLRNAFTRELGKPPSGSEQKSKPPWRFFDQMKFLIDSVRKRPTSGNVTMAPTRQETTTTLVANLILANTEVGVTEGDDENSPLETTGDTTIENDSGPRSAAKSVEKKKGNARRKCSDDYTETLLEHLEKSSEYTRDEDMLFGASIGAGLKELSKALKINTKIKIQGILAQAQLAEVQEQSGLRNAEPSWETYAQNVTWQATPGTSATWPPDQPALGEKGPRTLSINGSNLQDL